MGGALEAVFFEALGDSFAENPGQLDWVNGAVRVVDFGDLGIEVIGDALRR